MLSHAKSGMVERTGHCLGIIEILKVSARRAYIKIRLSFCLAMKKEQNVVLCHSRTDKIKMQIYKSKFTSCTYNNTIVSVHKKLKLNSTAWLI